MSNFTDTKKINSLIKNSLALVNTNSQLEFFDEVNIGAEYKDVVDVSDIIIDHITGSPDFTVFDVNYLSQSKMTEFGINLIDSGDSKKYEYAYLDNSQKIIKFERLKLEPVGTSVNLHGGSFYCLDEDGKNVLENFIPYMHGVNNGVLDDEYSKTTLEYKKGLADYVEVILQTNYHGTPMFNYKQGLVTFNSLPNWSLADDSTTSVPISDVTDLSLYLTFYKYVGKKGIRVLNTTDISGDLIVGRDFSKLSYVSAPEDGAIFQNKVGIGAIKDGESNSLLELRSYTNPSIMDSELTDNTSIYTGIPKLTLTGVYDRTVHTEVGSNSGNRSTSNYSRTENGEIVFRSMHENLISAQSSTPEEQARIFSFSEGSETKGGLAIEVTSGGTTTNIEALTIREDGKIGINRVDPMNSLDVSGSAVINRDSVTSYGITDPGLQTDSIVLHNNISGDDQMYIQRKDSSVYHFQTGQDEGEIHLQPHGNSNARVIIGGENTGNSASNYKLDVTGETFIQNTLTLGINDANSLGAKINLESIKLSVPGDTWSIETESNYFKIYDSDQSILNSFYVKTDSSFNYVGINKNSDPSEALDVSGNVMIHNSDNVNRQGNLGGLLKFDNNYGYDGVNKIILHSHTGNNPEDTYGFGVDANTLKYHSGNTSHAWYYDSQESTNGTLAMQLTSSDLLVVGDVSSSNLILDRHELINYSTGNYAEYKVKTTGIGEAVLYFTGYDSTSTTTKQDVSLKMVNYTSTAIQLSTNGYTYFKGGNVGIATSTPEEKLHIDGNIKITGNFTGAGLIVQTGSGTNTFSATTSEFSNRLQVNTQAVTKRLIIGDTSSSDTTLEDFVIKKSSGNPLARLINYGSLQFTNENNTVGTSLGIDPDNVDWKITHYKGSDTTYSSYNSTQHNNYGDHLSFEFLKNSLGASHKNVPLRLCAAEDTNGSFDNGLDFNAVFTGNVYINGNLEIEGTSTTQRTIVQTSTFDGGFTVEYGQTLYMGEYESGVNKNATIRFDQDIDSNQLTDNTGDKIIFYPKTKISVPTEKGMSFYVDQTSPYLYYTKFGVQDTYKNMLIDSSNNVVVGATIRDLSLKTSKASLLNIFGAENAEETTIQFCNGNDQQNTPYRIGIKSGDDHKNKFTVLHQDETDVFTVDVGNKRVGILQNTPTLVLSDVVLDINGGLSAAYNEDITSYIGHAAIGYCGDSPASASFSHINMNSATTFGLKQYSDGITVVNSNSSGFVSLSNQDVETLRVQSESVLIGTTTNADNSKLFVSGSTKITGDLNISDATSAYSLKINATDKILLDKVRISDSELKISPDTLHYTLINDAGSQTLDTYLRAGNLAGTVVIADTNTNGKIHFGMGIGSSVNSDYRIQSQSMAIASSGGNSIYTAGNVNVNSDLIITGTLSKFELQNADGATFTIGAATGNTFISGTLDVKEDLYINTDKFIITGSSGNTQIEGTLTLNNTLDVGGNATVTTSGAISTNDTLSVGKETTLEGDITIVNKSLETRDSIGGTQKFVLNGEGEVKKGKWESDTPVSIAHGGTGSDLTSLLGTGTAGHVMFHQGDYTFTTGPIVGGGGITVNSTATGITIENTDKGSDYVNIYPTANRAEKGFMSSSDYTALELMRDFFFHDNILTSSSDENEFREGLVRKITNYRTKQNYQYSNATMKPLYVGPFLYDTSDLDATYSDYGMTDVEVVMEGAGNYVIPDGNVTDNFTQETSTNYRVLFWQDYTPVSQFSNINVEFHCTNNSVDFGISNYNYNSVLCVNHYTTNPVIKTTAAGADTTVVLSDLLAYNRIMATGKTQVKNDKGPRGQLFPLMGHYDNVNQNTIRIMVLINKVDVDTDTSSLLQIDSRSAYLKITETTDSDITTN